MHSLQLSDGIQSDTKNVEKNTDEQNLTSLDRFCPLKRPFPNRVSNNTDTLRQNAHSLPDVKTPSDRSRSANVDSGQP